MKRKLYLILLAIVLPILTVLFLQKTLDKSAAKNGFHRNLAEGGLTFFEAIRTPSTNMYLIGEGNSSIYLRDLDNSARIYQTYIVTKTLPYWKVIDINHHKKRLNLAYLDSIFFVNVLDTDTGAIIDHQGNQKTKFELPSKGLSQSNLISGLSLVSREIQLADQHLERRLIKHRMFASKSISHLYQIKGSSDQYFSNDGMLRYDKKNASLFYMFFYTGQILCLDTNLNLRYTLKTVDTVKVAQINLKSSKRTKGNTLGNSISQAQPPKIVNRNFCVSEDAMFVLSNLKSDNEEHRLFHEQQIVDVYRITDGKYLVSFYLPTHEKERLKNILVLGDRLYALYKNHLVTYRGVHQLLAGQ